MAKYDVCVGGGVCNIFWFSWLYTKRKAKILTSAIPEFQACNFLASTIGSLSIKGNHLRMFRSAPLRLGAFRCSAVLMSAPKSSPTFTFQKKMSEFESDPENPIAQAEYKILQEKLALYVELQGEYSVKQSEIERAKRAANVCGLDFPSPQRRKEQ